MATPQINHIKRTLDEIFDGKIDLSDYSKKTPEETKKAFYSRALAAYSLVNLASCDTDDAADSITDGFQDNGIDAIFYDEDQCVLSIVQSKFIDDGVGEPENGDLRKFKDGINDLVGERFDRFNRKIQKKKAEIQSAFAESNIRLNIILAYTGRGFADGNRQVLDDIFSHLNDSTEWAFFTDYNLKAAHSSITLSLSGKKIDREIMLSNWGSVDEPHTAFYGQISAIELANLWKDYRKDLFVDNIRNFLGVSEINSQIGRTIENEPENFVYFNNGVTMLAETVVPLPAKTIGKSTGTFACTGISIINGAQTVGSLGQAIDKFPEQIQKCKVFIRLIPLAQAPEGFSTKITVAANTQNRIEKRDFVSLDPKQQSLKTELLLRGINYHYKRTDEGIGLDSKNCTLEEATISLACLHEDVSFAVNAKREIGIFWENTEREPYLTLFNEKLRPETLWKSVQVYRQVMAYLADQKNATDGREYSHFVFGNYFMLNMVFEEVSRDHIYNPSFTISDILSDHLDHKIKDVCDTVYLVAEELFPTALMHQLYRNHSKCREIKEKIQAGRLKK